MNLHVSRRELYEKMKEKNNETSVLQEEHVVQYVKNKFELNLDSQSTKSLHSVIRMSFFLKYYQRWKKCHRTESMFLRKYSDWLQQEIELPFTDFPSTSSEKRGRPSKVFQQLSERSKRRKIQNLRENVGAAELSYATVMNLRAEGDENAAKLLKEVTTTTPTRGKQIRDSWLKKRKQATKLSEEEALSMIVSTHLSKHQYMSIRKMAINHNHDLYPSYYAILKAKDATYPHNISVSESACEVKVQNLLDHTATRILSFLPESEPSNNEKTYILHCKWGFDGSAGHSQYKQKWVQSGSSDEYLFMTSIVPLRMVDSETEDSVWKNERPSSTRFCRPIRLQWLHETPAVAQAEREYMNEQIKNLQPLRSDNVTVQYSLILSMIDGKICNALTQSSSMKCYICGAKVSDLNKLDYVTEVPEDTSSFEFGLSILPAHIRFFECILHISYRLDFKKWKASKKDGTRELLEKRK